MHANESPHQPGPINAGRLAALEKRSAPPPLLSFKQAAELIGVSVRTFRTMMEEPWMPAPVELAPRVQKIVRDELLVAIASRAPRRSTRGVEPAQLAAARKLATAPAAA